MPPKKWHSSHSEMERFDFADGAWVGGSESFGGWIKRWLYPKTTPVPAAQSPSPPLGTEVAQS